nr:protein GVQW3-like [Lepeophtheirus salmonis]
MFSPRQHSNDEESNGEVDDDLYDSHSPIYLLKSLVEIVNLAHCIPSFNSNSGNNSSPSTHTLSSKKKGEGQKTTIKRWFADFKRTGTDDTERPGRPNEAIIPENIEKILKIIMGNCKVKLQEIADTLKLSKGSVYTIINEHLGMKKLFSKWVPRLSTSEQKQQREDD